MATKRFDASRAFVLDAPERLIWLPPAQVVTALQIRQGEVIADIGAGTGYFTLPMAGDAREGKVYAIDSQPEMLDIVAKKISAQFVSNVRLIHAEAHQTGLPSNSCSLVFLANVWHEFDERAEVLRESLRVLTRPGRIAILDWRADVEREAGPPLDHRLDASTAATELSAAGFLGISNRNIGLYSWLVQGTVLPNS
jgi:Methylase involved in ubiquinone/menaquinone biosynthesis